MSKAKRLLKEIRKDIPSFDCIPGCIGCCGPVPFSRLEWARVKDKSKATALNIKDGSRLVLSKDGSTLQCPYAGEKGCDIYEDRPVICRLFGTVERMKCPHGCGPEKMLTKEGEEEIIDAYWALLSRDIPS